MHISEHLTIDLAQNKVLDRINIKQYENGSRAIYINLTYNGEEIELGTGLRSDDANYPLSGQTHAAFVNASVNGVITAYEIPCSISDNKVVVPVNSALSMLSGPEKCEIKILQINNPRVGYSATFEINVEKSVIDLNAPEYEMTELSTMLSSLTLRMAAIEAYTTTENLQSIQNAVTSLSTRVTALENDTSVSALASRVTALENANNVTSLTVSKIWSGTQIAYNSLGAYDADTLYIITAS